MIPYVFTQTGNSVLMQALERHLERPSHCLMSIDVGVVICKENHPELKSSRMPMKIVKLLYRSLIDGAEWNN